MTSQLRTILLIEDNAPEAQLYSAQLQEMFGEDCTVRVECRLEPALAQLSEIGPDVILLDLTLPDSRGLETLERVRSVCQEVPVVVLTGLDANSWGEAALQRGAQDYLPKDHLTAEQLARAVRFAFLRHRLLGASGGHDLLEQELERLQSRRMMPVPVAAQAFATAPLRESFRRGFEDLVAQYHNILDLMLDESTFNVDHAITARVQKLADALGTLSAGPRDVLDLHEGALRVAQRDVDFRRAKAYVNESHMLLLELMGHLLSFYRAHARFARGGAGNEKSTVSRKDSP